MPTGYLSAGRVRLSCVASRPALSQRAPSALSQPSPSALSALLSVTDNHCITVKCARPSDIIIILILDNDVRWELIIHLR